MKVEEVVPILRIFDYQKAVEFYVDWLDFKIDWEHRFEENFPIYMQVSAEGIKLHLSEHHGDGTPGTQMHIYCTGLKAYQQKLIGKDYKYGKPGLKETFYDTWSMTVHDPFGNYLIFDERKIEHQHKTN